MKTRAMSPMPSARVTTTPSTSAPQPAALMPLSPSPRHALAITTMTMARTALATSTALQVDLRLMHRINGYGGGRRQTIFADPNTAIPAGGRDQWLKRSCPGEADLG